MEPFGAKITQNALWAPKSLFGPKSAFWAQNALLGSKSDFGAKSAFLRFLPKMAPFELCFKGVWCKVQKLWILCKNFQKCENV